MTRIAALTIEQAPEAARPALQGVEKGLGFLPNAFATMAHSPAAPTATWPWPRPWARTA